MIRIFLALLMVASLLPATVSAIDPANMTPEEYTMVEANCRAAQRSMQRIKYSEPPTRVNRGIAYSTINELMTALTNRAAYNAFRVPQLSIETRAVQDQRVQFGKDYTEYEKAFSELISMNCRQDPVEFYERLVDVRAKRSIVALRIREIEQRLDAFTVATNELEQLLKLQVREP